MTTPRAWKEAASSLQTRAEELSLELPVTKEVNDIRERPTSRTGMGVMGECKHHWHRDDIITSSGIIVSRCCKCGETQPGCPDAG